MKRNIMLIVIFNLIFFYMFIQGCNKQAPHNYRIGIFLYAQQPIITEIYAGFKREMNKQAASKKATIEYIERNSDGDMTQALAVASYFNTSDLDAIFVVGLPAAQALKSSRVNKPVIFGGPPDPVSTGLVPSLINHNTNFTGTKYFPPVDVILNVFKKKYPNANKISVLHNPGEANSMSVTKEFIARAKSLGIEIRDLGVTNSPEIDAALRTISIKKDDGVFIPTDNLIYSNLDKILSYTNKLNIPVFNCTKLSVEKGATFSIACDYDRVGEISAGIAQKIIFDKIPPQKIDVIDIHEGHIYTNKKDFVNDIGNIKGYDVISLP